MCITLVVILAVAAIFVITFVWRRKCICVSAIQNQPKNQDRHVALVHIQPNMVKTDTVHEFEDIY